MAEIKSDFEVMLDRIIGVTEKNITMQSTFLKEIHDIKSKFDMNDRDHQDVKESVKHTVENSFEILNMMKKTSNDDILSKFEELSIKINSLNIDDIGKDVKELRGNDKILKWIVGIISGFIIISSAMFGFWQNSKNKKLEKNLKTYIENIIKK